MKTTLTAMLIGLSAYNGYSQNTVPARPGYTNPTTQTDMNYNGNSNQPAGYDQDVAPDTNYNHNAVNNNNPPSSYTSPKMMNDTNNNGGQVTPAYTAPAYGAMYPGASSQTPACYRYMRNNREVIECPGRKGEINVNSEGTYMGYYPTTNPEDLIPLLKNDGKKIWLRPAYDEAYTITQDPPCFIYKRHNVAVMECPGIQFAPIK